jgi:hypothetical protein
VRFLRGLSHSQAPSIKGIAHNNIEDNKFYLYYSNFIIITLLLFTLILYNSNLGIGGRTTATLSANHFAAVHHLSIFLFLASLGIKSLPMLTIVSTIYSVKRCPRT